MKETTFGADLTSKENNMTNSQKGTPPNAPAKTGGKSGKKEGITHQDLEKHLLQHLNQRYRARKFLDVHIMFVKYEFASFSQKKHDIMRNEKSGYQNKNPKTSSNQFQKME